MECVAENGVLAPIEKMFFKRDKHFTYRQFQDLRFFIERYFNSSTIRNDDCFEVCFQAYDKRPWLGDTHERIYLFRKKCSRTLAQAIYFYADRSTFTMQLVKQRNLPTEPFNFNLDISNARLKFLSDFVSGSISELTCKSFYHLVHFLRARENYTGPYYLVQCTIKICPNCRGILCEANSWTVGKTVVCTRILANVLEMYATTFTKKLIAQ